VLGVLAALLALAVGLASLGNVDLYGIYQSASPLRTNLKISSDRPRQSAPGETATPNMQRFDRFDFESGQRACSRGGRKLLVAFRSRVGIQILFFVSIAIDSFGRE
jgi:hypothetical protein